MHCQICLTSESPSLHDMREQFFIFKDQRMDLLSCFYYCKQIKIDNEQNAKICENCQPKLTEEYVSKYVNKNVASITDQPDFLLAHIKKESELDIDSELVIINETTIKRDKIVVPKKEIIIPCQIPFPGHEIKEEAELQIDDDGLDSDRDIKTASEHFKDSLTPIPGNLQKDKYSECSTSKRRKLAKASGHLLTHVESNNYNCRKCSANFNAYSKLNYHRRRVHSAKRFKCLHCAKTFNIKSQLVQHMETHSNFMKYPCKFCSETFNTNSKLAGHFKNTHSMKKFKCHHCSAIKKTKENMKCHLMQHIANTPECSHCENKIKVKQIQSLPQLIDENENKYHCCRCAKVFKDHTSLYKHNRYMHSAKQFKCFHCAMTFTVKPHLIQHMESHSISKNHQCKQCGEVFYRKSTLFRHFRRTHSLLQFKCHHCSAIEKSKEKIKTHLTQHFEMYKCLKCEKKCTTAHNLAMHQLTHTNTKNYQCCQCSMTFKLKVYLNVHMKKKTCRKNIVLKDFHSDI